MAACSLLRPRGRKNEPAILRGRAARLWPLWALELAEAAPRCWIAHQAAGGSFERGPEASTVVSRRLHASPTVQSIGVMQHRSSRVWPEDGCLQRGLRAYTQAAKVANHQRAAAHKAVHLAGSEADSDGETCFNSSFLTFWLQAGECKSHEGSADVGELFTST